MVRHAAAPSVAATSWLVVSCARLLTLVTAFAGGVRFAYEINNGSDAYKSNPLRVALPESMLIRNVIWSFTLGGAQSFFVDQRAWDERGLGFNIVLCVLSYPLVGYAVVKATLQLNFIVPL